MAESAPRDLSRDDIYASLNKTSKVFGIETRTVADLYLAGYSFITKDNVHSIVKPVETNEHSANASTDT